MRKRKNWVKNFNFKFLIFLASTLFTFSSVADPTKNKVLIRDGSEQMNGPVNITATTQQPRKPIIVTNETMTQEQINQMALQQAQQSLTDSEKRQETIKNDPKAQKIDRQVTELMGAHSEDMYKAAADFLPYILKLGNGDPAKMAEIVKQAQRNPAGFVKDLPPELKQKVTDLSEKVKPVPEEIKP